MLIDTSTARCAVLLRKNSNDFISIEKGARGQDARLAPMVRDLLKAAKVKPRTLNRIAVIVGPGAFTGVRIGVAFARAFGLALGLPVLGINALDALALTTKRHPRSAGVCNIGRGELAWRFCKDGALQGTYETGPVERALSDLSAFGAGQPVHLAGSAASLADGNMLVDSGQHELDLGCAIDLWQAGALPNAPALPWYHRPPDAKLPGGFTP